MLGIGCYLWAGYSIIRFLFMVTEYAGWQWIISIIIEIYLGNFFVSKS